MNSKIFLSDTLLLLITIGWGYTYIAGKIVLEEISEFYYLSLRFLISAFCIFLFQIHRLKKFTIPLIQQAILCGIILGLAFYTQLIGLKITSPGTAGVITGLFVVIVPFVYFFFAKKPLQTETIIGSFLSFLGLFIFSYEEKRLSFNGLGEIFLFFSAFFFAVHIVLIDRAYRKYPNLDGMVFTFFQLFVVGVMFFFPAWIYESFPVTWSKNILYNFIYNVLVGTVIAYTAQTILQKYSPPTHVSLIFAFESVFAFFFSWIFYNEVITARILVGVFLMLGGIFVTEILDKYKFKLKGKLRLWQSQKKH